MAAVASALQGNGQPEEMAWPYSPIQVVPWVPPAIAGQLYKASMVLSRMTFAELLNALNRHQPVVLGIILTDAFYRPDASGVIVGAANDIERGGHAVLAVGHGVNQANEQAILIRNSWGSRWGAGGYAWMMRPYLERQLRQTAVIA